MKLPDFFENRTDFWNFEDILNFIGSNFVIKQGFEFRIGERINNKEENQRALLVFAYAQLMDYTFNQTKALFAEHDHFAIAVPETRQGRNILELNKIYTRLLQQGYKSNIKINDFPEYFDIPKIVVRSKDN
jgi:hypothetical protein